MDVHHDDTPDFGAERGLFVDRAVDHATHTGSGEWRQNRDFLRLKDLAIFLLDPRPGTTIVDFGCANGANMVYCGLQGAEVYGYDLDPARVAHANRKLAHLGLRGDARCGDARAVDLEDCSVDGAISSDFHEHLDAEAQVAVLREAHRVLRPGAPLVVKTPNLSYLRVSLLFKRARAIVRAQDPRPLRIPHTPGTDDPEHIGLLPRRALARQLQEAGFQSYEVHHPPLRRFGGSMAVEIASSEIPIVRDVLSEDLLFRARKPIALSHFPD